MVKRSGKSTWNSEKLSCGANLEVRTTVWLRKPAGSLESGSDGSGAHPTIWCLLATVEPSSACHWLTGGKVSWWTRCGRPDGPIQHQLLAPPRQQSSRVLPNLLPLLLAGTCPEVSIYVLMTFGGLVVRQGAADVH